MRCGMTHAVTSPGSRNAPLTLTLAGQPGLQAVSVIDERGAGFAALGMAKASGRPVAVTCTSGSAAANLHPAVVEAWEARVPLIVLTADRPPELRGIGAGQSIDQLGLYGSAAKWFVEVGTHEPGRNTAIHHRALACRAYYTAAGGRPGPVHLNFPLREPLAPSPEELDPEDWRGREDGRPWTELREARSRVDTVSLPEGRGVVVCGPTSEGVAEPVVRFAERLGWPVLAEPTSGLRCGAHDRSRVIAHYDVLLRVPEFAESERAEVVVRVGDMPTSKSLRAWVAGAQQVVIDPHAVWHEPTRRADLILRSSVPSALDALDGERCLRRLGRALARRRRDRAGGAGRLACALRAQGSRRAGARAAGRGGDLGQFVDADSRCRGILPAVAQGAALPGQPGGQRDRRSGLVGPRCGARHGPPDVAAHGRAGAAARRRRAARRPARRRRAEHRLSRQRGRRNIRLPALGGSRRSRPLRGAHRHTRGPGLRCAQPRDHRGAHKPRRERAPAPRAHRAGGQDVDRLVAASGTSPCRRSRPRARCSATTSSTAR